MTCVWMSARQHTPRRVVLTAGGNNNGATLAAVTTWTVNRHNRLGTIAEHVRTPKVQHLMIQCCGINEEDVVSCGGGYNTVKRVVRCGGGVAATFWQPPNR